MSMTIVPRIKEFLELRGMTQAELSRELGWDESYTSRVVNGQPPTLLTATKVAQALNVPIEELWVREQ